MESERDAWGLSSADWCHVAINFKRSARIVQTSFSVLLFLKKKKEEEREPFPLVLHPRCTLLSRFTSFRTHPGSRGFILSRKGMERRETINAREFFWICDHLWYSRRGKVTSEFFYFFFFLKRRNKDVSVSSRLVNIIKYW